MKRIDYSKDYQKVIQSHTDRELTEIYLNANDYTEEFIALLLVELNKRGIPVEELTSKEKADLFLIRKKSDEELHDIYTDTLDYPQDLRTLAEEEAKRRGLSIDTIEQQKIEANSYKGVEGKHIIAGFLFSILGGVIGLIIALDYVFSKTTDGAFYKYDENTRKSGKYMFIVLVISVTLTIVIRCNS
ncbi:MAG: hypothetical protein LBI60_04230 [Bacteroidales bacterium]|jgi:hypothetical protein|nr:hypothetical protein [Bacteroidales bacterium]